MRSGLIVSIAVLLFVSVFLGGCSPQLNLAAVGTMTLYQAVRPVLREQFGAGVVIKIAGATTRVEEFMSQGTLAQGRFPEWATGQYTACVHWKDPYQARGVSGPMKKGTVHGWILVDKDLNTHILEFSLESEETGERLVILDQWDGQVETSDEGAGS